ncbi:hypothetical protein [Anaeromusa sp.]|uniref:hypothetical protein n=1 Tax=Anaeromusa sp. TaxID=1872520 RepID=UPI00262BA1F4|nr:hypothetical protein [Anaeromusa sp.]MDD3157116.1 hypothetical protein [Anaeromusa sp.]
MVNLEWLQMDVRELWEKLTEVQRRLVVGIGIAVLGLFGYWLESRPDGAVVTETPVAMKPAAPVATPEAKSGLQQAVPQGGATVSARDPFAPPAEYRSLAGAAKKTPTAAAVPQTVSMAKASASAAPVPASAQVSLQPMLTGIARSGGQTMALVRYEGRTRAYGLGEGPGAYRVVQIDERSALLEGPEGQRSLSMGH